MLAQQARVRPTSVDFSTIESVNSDRLLRLAPDSSGHHRTYWLEGGLIGIGAVAALTLATAHNNCEGGANCAAANFELFVLGSGILFPLGALIGAQFSK